MKKYSLFLFFILSAFTVFSQNLSISGRVAPVCDATVTLLDKNGNPISSISTADSGNYIFSNLEIDKTYAVNVTKEVNTFEHILNGVSTFDVVLISKHIIGVEEFTDPFLLFAADVDGSESVSVMDLVLLRRVILGIDSNFPVDSWQFFSTDAQIENLNNPWQSPNLKTRIYENLSTSIDNADFIGYKIGDINGSSAVDCN